MPSEPKRLFASTSKPSGSIKPSISTSNLGATPAASRHRTPGPRHAVQTFSTLRTPAPGPTSFHSPTGRQDNLHSSTLQPTPAPGQSHRKHASPGPTPLPARGIKRSSKSGQPSPGPTPLPSATRTRRRSRQSFTPTQEFQTPAPRWEEEHSLGSITEGVEGLELVTLNELEELDEGHSEDELEYMPPPMKGESDLQAALDRT